MNLNRLNLAFGLFFFFTSATVSSAQNRTEIEIPNILGYQTLKCDFHMHTVFSDGEVWPTVRVQEAWIEGLDAIAITDHVDFLPHSQDVEPDHNRPYEIAQPLAEQLGLMLIKGVEITRGMPPGHLSALFVKNANLIDREDWWESCVEATEQGAFFYWSHPGRKDQQPNQTIWWPDHTRLFNAGMLKGIEVYTKDEEYPEALRWADERSLTIFANSDLHEPESMVYNSYTTHRPITLVFATDKSVNAIKDALLNQRTVVYFDNKVIGDRKFLTPLFVNSIEIKSAKPGLQNNDVKEVMIHNKSDITYILKKRQPSTGFSGPSEIILEAHKTVAVELIGTSYEVSQMTTLKMYYEATNLLSKKGEKLPVNIDIPNK